MASFDHQPDLTIPTTALLPSLDISIALSSALS